MQASDGEIDAVLRGLQRVVQQVRQASFSDPVDRAAIVVLARLRDRGPLRLSDLAADLCLDASTVSRQVKDLEERGLVARTVDPDDRRAAQVEVTPEGYVVLAAAWSRRHDWLTGALAAWPVADRSRLAATLHRFADSLQADAAPQRLPRSRPPATTSTSTEAST